MTIEEEIAHLVETLMSLHEAPGSGDDRDGDVDLIAKIQELLESIPPDIDKKKNPPF